MTTAPTPSVVRTVAIYPGGRGPGQGLLGPNAILTWPSRNSGDSDYFWIDLTGWATDSDVSLIQLDAEVSSGDGQLTLAAVGTSGNYGFVLPENGTPGQSYIIQLRAITSAGTSDVFYVTLPVSPNPF